MSRKAVVLLGAIAMALALPMVAFAGPWTVSVGGGAAIPTGDFADADLGNAKTGFQFGGAVDYRLNQMFGVGIDGSWNRNTHDGEGETFGTFTLDEDRYDTWQVGAHGQYFIPAGGNIQPYLLAGVGAYNIKEEWSGTDSVTGPESGKVEFDTNFGFKVGAGGVFNINELLGIGVEGNYNFVTQDKDKVGVDSLQYIGVSAMLIFSLMQQ